MTTRYSDIQEWATAVLKGQDTESERRQNEGVHFDYQTGEMRFRCPLCKSPADSGSAWGAGETEFGSGYMLTFGCDHWALFLLENFKGELTFTVYGTRSVDKIEKAMERAREVNDAQKFEYLVDLHKQAIEKGYKPTYPKARYKATYGAWPSWADDERAAKEAAK